jgi:hypothetical protein
MSKLVSSAFAPFAKFVGAVPPGTRIPEGYEAVKTGTRATYVTGRGDDPSALTTTISAEQYEKYLQAAESRPSSFDIDPGGEVGVGRAAIESRYQRKDEDVYQILPIARNQTTAPAAPSPAPRAPTTPSLRAPTTPSLRAAPVASVAAARSPAPPSGGPQPTQPAQPVTSATATVPKIKPARPVSSPVGQAGIGGAAPKRPGRRAFVRTTPVGLTTQAGTQKKRLLGA